MSSALSVVEYFDEIGVLLVGKLLVVPSAVGGIYEIKEPGQTTFAVTPQNLAHHRCVSLEKNAANFSMFKLGHNYAHRRADRLFVAWDAQKNRIVYLACELKSQVSSGAWTQLQVTLAFARHLDALIRVNKTMPHTAVFAAATIRSMPVALKSFNPMTFVPVWNTPLKGCPLSVHHCHFDRALSPLRLRDTVFSLP